MSTEDISLPAADDIEAVQGSQLDGTVTVRFPPALAEAAKAQAAAEGASTSAWVRKLVGEEIGRRDGIVSVSRADLELVLRDAQPPEDEDEDRAARRRLWDAVVSSGRQDQP